LGGEGRMSADLDGDMAPLGIEDMEGVVVHVGHGLLAFEEECCGMDDEHLAACWTFLQNLKVQKNFRIPQVNFVVRWKSRSDSARPARKHEKQTLDIA
jgi:hypothetical protein